MPALDPRLVRRARPVRALLAVDVAAGLATALLVLAGATLLARVIAGAAGGDSLGDVRGELVALAVVFALRGALAWAFEAAGRRGRGPAAPARPPPPPPPRRRP